jgi:hypothetical protein
LKEAYRSLCRTQPGIPLFSKDWWLDTVCGEDKWRVLLAEEKGNILAAMPLYIPHPKIISMPPYTQTMGVWFAQEAADAKYTATLGKRQALCKRFVEALKPYPSFLQNFHYKITDWLPFYWEGYRQTTRYTYLLPDIREPERLWGNMSPNIRRNICKARDKFRIEVKRDIPVDSFLRVYALSFERQRRRAPHTDTLKRLIAKCRERGQGCLWGGYDTGGRLHAAAFIVWQESSAYYLAGGCDPALRASGAHSLALWEGIQYAARYTSLFDFEGSMIPGVERFFREFGAIQTPFFTLYRNERSLFYRIRLKLGV